jgi:hypothetical protein
VTSEEIERMKACPSRFDDDVIDCQKERREIVEHILRLEAELAEAKMNQAFYADLKKAEAEIDEAWKLGFGELGPHLKERGTTLGMALSKLRETMLLPLNDWADKDDKWTKEVEDAFPTRSGSHKEYQTAMEMIHARHSKGAIVALINWLLLRINLAETKAQKFEDAMRDCARAHILLAVKYEKGGNTGGAMQLRAVANLLYSMSRGEQWLTVLPDK